MAKKKRSKSAKQETAPDDFPLDASSAKMLRRSLEGMMSQIIGGIAETDFGFRPDSAVERAQEIVYAAWEADDDSKRIAMARKALKISPDCADAYVMLAEEADSLEEATKLYEQGVAAGERALGEKAFRDYAGEFWGLVETRPYMRAREGLANSLWAAGRRDEAVKHYEEMLGLNPNDNQGIRYSLASSLLMLGRHEELAKLLKRYEDDGSAQWAYTEALLAFRQEGDSTHARSLLKKAQRANRYVPAYLTGNKPLPRYLPDYISPGKESEGVSYAASDLVCWRDTPGAVSWLRVALKVPLARPKARKNPAWPQLRVALGRLSQADEEVWQLDVRREEAAEDEGGKFELWRVMITCPSEDSIVTVKMETAKPSMTAIWRTVFEAMMRPRDGEPHRPARIEVQDPRLAKSWQAKLRQIGVELFVCESLDHLEGIARETAPPVGTLQRMVGDPLEIKESALAELDRDSDDLWQADVRPMATWFEEDGVMKRPRTTLVSSPVYGTILAHDVRVQDPTADWLWQTICQAMLQPAIGAPHRPAVIEVRTDQTAQSLRPRLAPLEIECRVQPELKMIDALLEDMAREIFGAKAASSLLDSPGVTPEQLASLFEAAAAFYRRTPWKRVPAETILMVDCDKFQNGRWYGLVMGQTGVTLGLALYEDLEVIRDIFSGQWSDEENCRRTSGLSLTYGEPFDMAPADLDAAEKHGWPIAGPEAYPSVLRLNPGMAMRSPLGWELELLEGCLRTIPDFILEKSHEAVKTARIASGPLTLKITRLEEDEVLPQD